MAEQSEIRILVADDDKNIAQLIAMECELEGLAVDVVKDGQQAILRLREADYALAILDWNMPLMSGYDVCRRLRETGSGLPILMVTARDQTDDLVQALDAGADDYLCKPFNIRALIARVKALLRRTSASRPSQDVLRFQQIELDTKRHCCSLDGALLHLTVREFDLLVALMEHPGQAMTRTQLIERVWGDDYFGDESVVDTYIRYLRKKLEADGAPRLIQTIRGVGFSLRAA
ncbi:MAG: response regulator transcription factor [Synechococcus sp.]|nr:response regulator transcription factor [Synechococcus sp.]